MVPSIETTEIDGVRTLWSDIPGPFTAILTFRVGVADERAPVAGVTHLVEHLAMPREDPPDVELNGDSDIVTTRFVGRGEPTEVCRFLADVSTALTRLPTSGIEQEIGVVRTELASNDVDVTIALLGLRFGAREHGLSAFEPLGYRRRSGMDAAATSWAERYFTRANARLCLTGRPPAELAVPLPDGEVRSPGPIAPLAVDLPAWTTLPSGVVAIGMLGSWQLGLGTALEIAARRLRRALRDAGASYDVERTAMPLDAAHVHHALAADCTAENGERVRDATLRVLGELVAAGPTDEELRDERRRFARETREPGVQLEWLVTRAESELIGGWAPTSEEYADAVESLGATDASQALGTAMASAILALPEGTDGPRRGWQPMPKPTTLPTSGRQFRPSGIGWLVSPERVVVGADAISYRGGDRLWLTIRWGDVEFFGHEGSYGVFIADRHGQVLQLAMETWTKPDELYQAIIRHVPREVRVSIDLD